jgi:hypothetical protein
MGHSAETREKIRAARLGKRHTEETKARMSAACLGKKHADETRQKMRSAHLGKRHTEESREKIRLAHLGKKHSEEARQKMRESIKRNQVVFQSVQYPSVSGAMRATGVSRHFIQKELRAKNELPQKGGTHTDMAGKELKKQEGVDARNERHEAEFNNDAAFEEFWAAYAPTADQKQYKPACLRLFVAALHEGHDASDIIAGAQIAAANGSNCLFPYCWLKDNKWIRKQESTNARNERCEAEFKEAMKQDAAELAAKIANMYRLRELRKSRDSKKP